MPDNVMNKYIRRAEYQAAVLVRDKARDLAPARKDPYPATRQKAVSPKMLAKKIAQLEKYNIEDIANKIITLSYGFSGKAKANRDRKPGTLKKGLVIGNSRDKGTRDLRSDKNFIVLSVGLTKRAYYGYWIEHGFMHTSGPRKNKIALADRSRDTRGRFAKEASAPTNGSGVYVPAHPFLRPAFDSQVEALINKFKAVLAEFVKDAERA
jgi:hypothetical protein